MATITLEVPDAIAEEVRRHQDRIPDILASGLQVIGAEGNSTSGTAAEVFAFFSRKPTAKQVHALRPSRALQKRIDSLLEKSREEGLSADEQNEWDEYELAEHLVRMAKSRAHAKLSVK
jgi:hypothetical protein